MNLGAFFQKWLLIIFAFAVCECWSFTAFAQTTPIRIRARNSSFTDGGGNVWSADRNFSGGTFYTSQSPIGGTTDDALYQSERYGTSFSYAIPINNGTYDLTIKFAEIYHSATGRRVFDIDVEGTKFVDDLDLFAVVGKDQAYDITKTVVVSDGVLNIALTSSKDNAKLSAIQILDSVGPTPTTTPTATPSTTPTTTPTATATPTVTPTVTATPTTTPTNPPTVSPTPTPSVPGTIKRINCGGGSFTDSLGELYTADSNFSGGSAYQANSPIAGTNDDTLYQSERYGAPFSYAVPVTNGYYEVTFRFAEIYFTAANQRVFDVDSEGVKLIDDLDLFSVAGKDRNYDVVTQVQVNDGTLNLLFSASKNNAKCSAIKIVPLQAPTATPTPTPSATPSPTTTLTPTSTPTEIPTETPTATPSVTATPSPTPSDAPTPTETPTTTPTVTASPISTPAASPTALPNLSTVRIHSGGSNYTDSLGNFWSADSNFSGGSTYSTTAAISGTSDSALYRTERYGAPFSYAVPVTNGNYKLTLKFAEIYWDLPNKRKFDVTVEGVKIAANVDIWAQVGKNKAYDIVYPLTVTDGTLNIQFAAVLDQAKVASIEVVPDFGSPNATSTATPTATATQTPTVSPTVTPAGTSTPTPTATTTPTPTPSTSPFAGIRINSGGGLYSSMTGDTWNADSNFAGGQTYSTNASIASTVDDTIYQFERWGNNFSYNFSLPNGTYDVTLRFAEIYFDQPGQRIFDVSMEGVKVITNLDLYSVVGKNRAYEVTKTLSVSDGELNVQFSSTVNNAKISGIRIAPQTHSHPFLHVVIDAPKFAVDDNEDGTELVSLSGVRSHTHQIGHVLHEWNWSENHSPIGSGNVIQSPFAVGSHEVQLEIVDDNVPPEKLVDHYDLNVYPPNAVGGVIARYYNATGVNVTSYVDSLPAVWDFEEVLPSFKIESNASQIGGSPFTFNVVLQMLGHYEAPTDGVYTFNVNGGSASRIFVDNVLVTDPIVLTAGPHEIEVRVGIEDQNVMPAMLQVSIDGAAPVSPVVTHDETTLAPFINSMPNSGGTLGGESVTISGYGFFGNVVVHWGATDVSGTDLQVQRDSIKLVSPPGSGTVSVTVETDNGISNAFLYGYSNQIPVTFSAPSVIANPFMPTQAAWGPDGRLYVATITGNLVAYTVDDNYNVTDTQDIVGVSGLTNNNILGLAFNPLESSDNFKIYIAHSLIHGHGSSCYTGYAAYTGQISTLQSPDFTTVTPLITQLPVSNHDHGPSGMVFNNAGDLLITLGGNTNAGVHACNMGDIPESPLSGAIVLAHISKPEFNGHASYVHETDGMPNDDQQFGEHVNLVPGLDLTLYGTGFRNPFDLTLTTSNNIFATDNGPNDGFGPASTGLTTEGPEPTAPDELVLLGEGHYYGHPNRNRGRFDDRENIYRHTSSPSILGDYTSQIGLFQSSTNGIEEYRATSFGSRIRGALLLQQWNNNLYVATPTADGRALSQVSTIANAPKSLDVITGPGGAILGSDFTGSKLNVMLPNDLQAVGTYVYDIFPWRASSEGGTPFVIGGGGFGSMANTTVTIGGVSATVTAVSANRIRGIIPAKSTPTGKLLDVVVNTASQTKTLTSAFRYVFPTGSGVGTWSADTAMPTSLGEVAAGIIRGVVYVVGEGSSNTFAFDPVAGTWTTKAARPFAGHHHAAEVINNKLYLFGGLHDGSDTKVQIYDPVTNTWSPGMDMPFASGSGSSALIGDKVYYAGGISGNSTTTQAAVYNSKTDSWSLIAPMPIGRNHAASGTDGQNFYIFGGRGPGSGDDNSVAIGFDEVQVYDPLSNTWTSSVEIGSQIPPLPQKRGGTGKAVYFNRELYVMGGETTPSGTGQVAGNVYNRVDVYNPVTKTWRLEAPLLTARHGIFPVVYGDKIIVIGGGTSAGFSASGANEVFNP